MRTAIRIVLYPFDFMRAGSLSLKVNRSYPSSVASSSMSNGDVSCVVAPAFAVPDLRKCEWVVWPAFPEVVVYRAFEVAKPWSARFVGTKDDVLFATMG